MWLDFGNRTKTGVFYVMSIVIVVDVTVYWKTFAIFFVYNVLLFSGRTFPVEQLFLEDIMEITNYVLEENGPYTRKVKKGNFL